MWNGLKNIGKKISKMRIRRLEFSDYNRGVVAFTTERGVVDPRDSYSSFNCCYYTGDDERHVQKCREELCREIGVSDDALVLPRQIHGTEVFIVDTGFMRQSAEVKRERLQGIDAIVTNMPGVVVGVFTADCVPMLFWEPKVRIVGVAHGGWKGTAAGIAHTTIDAMERLGADVNEIRVTFGPAICQHCFEVGEEVVETYEMGGFDMNRICRRNHDTGKAHIDLVEANVELLLKKGIAEDHITKSDLCTKCHPDEFFSARVLGFNSGRVVTGIAMK